MSKEASPRAHCASCRSSSALNAAARRTSCRSPSLSRSAPPRSLQMNSNRSRKRRAVTLRPSNSGKSLVPLLTRERPCDFRAACRELLSTLKSAMSGSIARSRQPRHTILCVLAYAVGWYRTIGQQFCGQVAEENSAECHLRQQKFVRGPPSGAGPAACYLPRPSEGQE